MSHGPTSTEVVTQSKPLVTDEVFIVPTFVGPEKIGLKIIDVGYTVNHPDHKKVDDIRFGFLSSYIDGPLMSDDITKDRNVWKEEQSKEAQELMDKNRIGIRAIVRPHTSFCLLLEEPDPEVYLDTQTIEEMENLIEYIDENKNQVIRTENWDHRVTYIYNLRYDKLSVSQKLDFINRITKTSIEILRQNGFTVEKRSFNQPDLS